MRLEVLFDIIIIIIKCSFSDTRNAVISER